MKNFFQTLKNIWSIEELRSKILFTLLMITIYRIGAHIALPGIDPIKLSATAESLRQLIIVKPEKFSVFSVNDLVSNYKT